MGQGAERVMMMGCSEDSPGLSFFKVFILRFCRKLMQWRLAAAAADLNPPLMSDDIILSILDLSLLCFGYIMQDA